MNSNNNMNSNSNSSSSSSSSRGGGGGGRSRPNSSGSAPRPPSRSRGNGTVNQVQRRSSDMSHRSNNNNNNNNNNNASATDLRKTKSSFSESSVKSSAALLPPQDVSIFHSDSSADITTEFAELMKARSAYLALNYVGTYANVLLRSGETVTGVVHALTVDNGIGVVLRMATYENADSSSRPADVVVCSPADVVEITTRDMLLAEDIKSGQLAAGGFQTDAAISGAQYDNPDERVLVQWQPDQDLDMDFDLAPGDSSSGWDQFATNAALYQYQSSYKEEIYTTTLDTNHPDFQRKKAEADRLAREIMSNPTSNIHLLEERGQSAFDDSNVDEEDRYGAVVRDAPVLQGQNQPNKYVPPHLRRPAAATAATQPEPTGPLSSVTTTVDTASSVVAATTSTTSTTETAATTATATATATTTATATAAPSTVSTTVPEEKPKPKSKFSIDAPAFTVPAPAKPKPKFSVDADSFAPAVAVAATTTSTTTKERSSSNTSHRSQPHQFQQQQQQQQQLQQQQQRFIPMQQQFSSPPAYPHYLLPELSLRVHRGKTTQQNITETYGVGFTQARGFDEDCATSPPDWPTKRPYMSMQQYAQMHQQQQQQQFPPQQHQHQHQHQQHQHQQHHHQQHQQHHPHQQHHQHQQHQQQPPHQMVAHPMDDPRMMQVGDGMMPPNQMLPMAPNVMPYMVRFPMVPIAQPMYPPHFQFIPEMAPRQFVPPPQLAQPQQPQQQQVPLQLPPQPNSNSPSSARTPPTAFPAPQ